MIRKERQTASRSKPETLKATAYHEAGHAMAAWFVGIPFRKSMRCPSFRRERHKDTSYPSTYCAGAALTWAPQAQTG